MMPDNAPSAVPVASLFTGARALAVTATVDYEDGGLAIQDPSQGSQVQRWRARLVDASRVLLDAPTVAEFVAFEAPEISEISFTFDQNMRLCLAFVQYGRAKLYWFDSTLGAQVITELAIDVRSPRVCLDDKRHTQTSKSDIILAYKRGDSLYWRTQRERFTIERLWAENVPKGPLIKIGFSRQLRLQAQVAYS